PSGCASRAGGATTHDGHPGRPFPHEPAPSALSTSFPPHLFPARNLPIARDCMATAGRTTSTARCWQDTPDAEGGGGPYGRRGTRGGGGRCKRGPWGAHGGPTRAPRF